jgi:hypothetical protein
MSLEILKPTPLEELIGLAIGEHSVEIKCDAQLMAVVVV